MSIESNEDEERLIAKIRKLFALATCEGAQGAEAENAIRMANALLAKHSIEKHRLHEEDKVFVSFVDYPIKSLWIKSVIASISRFYNCRVVFDTNWNPPKTLIIGTSSNRITAVLVIDHLIDQIKKETKGEKIDFKNGAALGLAKKCNDIIKERNATTGHDEVIPGTGLTIIAIEEQQKILVDGFISENFPKLGKSKGIKNASQEGFKYGGGLNPNARVGGNSQKRLS